MSEHSTARSVQFHSEFVAQKPAIKCEMKEKVVFTDEPYLLRMIQNMPVCQRQHENAAKFTLRINKDGCIV